MTWAKVDDRLHGHPKVVKAGLEAMGLWALGLSHCAAYMTDGHLDETTARRLAGARLGPLAARLVASGLWSVHPSGGWTYHDYLDHNPSAEQVRQERERKAEAGRRGGLSKAFNRAAAGPSGASTSLAPPSVLLPESAVLPSRPDPVPISDPPVGPPLGGAPKVQKSGRPDRKKPASRRPEGWAPNEGHFTRGAGLGLPRAAVEAEALRFSDFHDGKGNVFADWDAAFRTWLGNVPRFATPGSGVGSVTSTKPAQELVADVEREDRERDARGERERAALPGRYVAGLVPRSFAG